RNVTGVQTCALPIFLGFDGELTLFHGSLVPFRLAGLALGVAALLQDDREDPQAHPDADADVGKVEHGKVHEQQVDVVHHPARGDAVDQVADAAPQHQHQGPALQLVVAAV